MPIRKKDVRQVCQDRPTATNLACLLRRQSVIKFQQHISSFFQQIHSIELRYLNHKHFFFFINHPQAMKVIDSSQKNKIQIVFQKQIQKIAISKLPIVFVSVFIQRKTLKKLLWKTVLGRISQNSPLFKKYPNDVTEVLKTVSAQNESEEKMTHALKFVTVVSENTKSPK